MRHMALAPWMAAAGIILAVDALWQPGTLAPAAEGHRLALNLPEWLVYLLGAAAMTMFLAIVSALIPPPRRKNPDDFEPEPPPRPYLSPAMLLLLVLLLAGFVTAAVIILRLIDPDVLWAAHSRGPPVKVLSFGTRVTPPRPDVMPWANISVTVVLSLLAALMIGLALMAFAMNPPWVVIVEWFRRSTRHRRPRPADLASALSIGIREIETGDDPRRAVIACYRRCEAALVARGRSRYASETPREFVQSALIALALPKPAVQALLLVFERARFGDLPITHSHCVIALHALGIIRSALENQEPQ